MQRSYLEANWRNGVRLLKLINDLLDLAKMGEGFLRLRTERTDVERLLQEIVGYSRPLAARKKLALNLVVARAPENLHVDVEKLERVVVNLVSNALKFTEKGAVTVYLDSNPREARITVEDTGIGIAAETIPMLFERFSQGDTSITRRFGGTGLGLAYAKEIVELHGGHITVASTPGEGSKFAVHLRQGDDAVPEKVRDRRVAAGRGRPAQAAGRPGAGGVGDAAAAPAGLSVRGDRAGDRSPADLPGGRRAHHLGPHPGGRGQRWRSWS